MEHFRAAQKRSWHLWAALALLLVLAFCDDNPSAKYQDTGYGIYNP